MPVDEAHFKLAMSHFASGVTIVTTHVHGKDHGMTVAAFSSLSLRPPLVLICIEKSVRTHEAISDAGKFAVNILGKEQADLSTRFSSRVEDRFEGVPIERGDKLGLPVIAGAITALECRVTAALPGGDHTIFVGEVEGIRTVDGPPLLYYRSGYREIQF